MGKILMAGGAILVVIGFIVWLGGDKFKWFGRLPGDIRIRRPGFSFYMPVSTMILLSLLLSGLIWLVRKFLK